MSYLRQVINFLEFIGLVIVHFALMDLTPLARRVALLGALTLLVGPLAAAADLRAVRLTEGAEATRLAIELSEPAAVTVFTLESPKRTVIDLAGTGKAPSLRLPKAVGGITALRVGQQAGGVLRLVVETQRGVELTTVTPLQAGARIARLDFAASSAAAAATLAPSPVAVSAAAVSDDSIPTALKPIKAAHAPPAEGREVIVAIDAGHGGQDPGAIGPAGTREKDVVLEISRELAERINREPGMRAILTRDGDYFLKHRERIRRARDAGAQLFVSVHADAVRDRSVSGSSVYVLSEKGATDEQARWLADRENAADLVGGVSLDDKDPMIASVLVDLSQSAQISQSMIAAERVLRSLVRVNEVRKPQVQQAGFLVLKSPDVPSMLVETAFISNAADERLLGRADRRRELAEAIFDGVKQYFIDHPPDGSRFALARQTQRKVVATADDGAAGRSGKL
ncbi:MAG: AMIN domain-containing protein [Sinobacteraceae bacterium]|nr:AMIN domain-containing protein [Nevskiaceae bacterium]